MQFHVFFELLYNNASLLYHRDTPRSQQLGFNWLQNEPRARNHVNNVLRAETWTLPELNKWCQCISTWIELDWPKNHSEDERSYNYAVANSHLKSASLNCVRIIYDSVSLGTDNDHLISTFCQVSLTCGLVCVTDNEEGVDDNSTANNRKTGHGESNDPLNKPSFESALHNMSPQAANTVSSERLRDLIKVSCLIPERWVPTGHKDNSSGKYHSHNEYIAVSVTNCINVSKETLPIVWSSKTG